ncbi:MAG TPA: hypothetical protein VFO62_09060, partial [Candidatus Binatia bacterium]|nr:hypothetical protein [Candidatus Binatia bacterium]
DPDASPWNMPELRWVYGYPFVLVLMLGVAALTFGYIYRKGWVGRAARLRPESAPSRDVE